MSAVVKAAPASMGMILRPQTFADLVKFSEMAANSQFVPNDYRGKPANIMLAVQMGSELGLAPMQSLQNISCINGRPAVWGDAMPGLCYQSLVCDYIKEWFEGDGDTLTAVCEAKRTTQKVPSVGCFSVADAKKAGLFGKSGPWQQYTRRMLQMRARGFALRDAFPDVLRGLISVEEARDIPADASFTGTTIEVAPEEPVTPKKSRTAKDVLEHLGKYLGFAITAKEVTDIGSSDDARKIFGLGEGHKAVEELKAMLADAMDRVSVDDGSAADEPVEEDTFPGDR